ncbi:Nn.00g088540.m01.CDS01 [Neocucurbitaria sp. VM-36]
MQQPAPPPPSHMPPLPPKLSTPPLNANKPAQSDMFLNMIQGPAVTVIVGASPSAPQYTLPVALLSIHSIYFRDEIARLDSLHAPTAINKKRKLSPYTEITPLGNTEASKAVSETTRSTQQTDPVIRLPDIDPLIFGLFLKYIYQGSYPASVDAKPSPTQPHHPPPLPTPPPPPSTATAIKRRYQAYDTIMHTSPSKKPAPHTAHAGLQIPSQPPPQDPSASTHPCPLHTALQRDPIPPSIHAWLLAQRLGAIGFMNHALTRIYGGVGTYFALTPWLLDYVWANTSVSTSTTDTNAFTSSSSSSSSPSFPYSGVVPTPSPSPLRTLLLHILTTHWSSPVTHIVAKAPALNAAWSALFDAHADLRREFIFGLRGGAKVLSVQGYFVGAGVKAGAGVEKMGMKGGGQKEGVVGVKREEGVEGDAVGETTRV